jgi:hypothetical protein
MHDSATGIRMRFIACIDTVTSWSSCTLARSAFVESNSRQSLDAISSPGQLSCTSSCHCRAGWTLDSSFHA